MTRECVITELKDKLCKLNEVKIVDDEAIEFRNAVSESFKLFIDKAEERDLSGIVVSCAGVALGALWQLRLDKAIADSFMRLEEAFDEFQNEDWTEERWGSRRREIDHWNYKIHIIDITWEKNIAFSKLLTSIINLCISDAKKDEVSAEVVRVLDGKYEKNEDLELFEGNMIAELWCTDTEIKALEQIMGEFTEFDKYMGR